MDRVVYDRMAAHDTSHWWYRARRDILADYIDRYAGLPPDARILEVGCGTGHNLPMLGAFGTVDAIEIDPAARAIASRRLGRLVGDAPLPALTGVARGSYDLVAALDVMEHVVDDVAALRAMAECLKPGGKILMTVPAHQWLWSAHDKVNHHHRRYSRARLIAVLRQAGLGWQKLGYFNSLLFPVAVAARFLDRLTDNDDSGDSLPSRPVNAAFEKIFRLERHALGRVPFPPGLSLIALAMPDGK
jgi:SAM-dependent methyltransferase